MSLLSFVGGIFKWLFAHWKLVLGIVLLACLVYVATPILMPLFGVSKGIFGVFSKIFSKKSAVEYAGQYTPPPRYMPPPQYMLPPQYAMGY